MKIILVALIEISFFVLIWLLIDVLQNNVNISKKIMENKKISEMVLNISSNKKRKKKFFLTLFTVIVVYLGLFSIIFHTINVWVASLIFSIPILLSPYIFNKIKEIKRKKEIVSQLQIYSLNLKNNIKNDNNIVLAIKRTKVEGALKEHILQFIKDIDNGISIYEAFNKLDKALSVAEFSELMQAIVLCYKTGGEFSNILEVYSKQLSDKLLKQEKEKEKSLSTVITLGIMIALNIFMLIVYIPQNSEMITSFSGNLLGRFLIDVNAITTLCCMFFLYKIYKMEE